MAIEQVHLENRAIRLLRKLVSAVAGADGDGQRIHAGALGKLDCLVGIGDVIEARTAGSVAVFNAAQNADFAFDRDAALVRVIDNLAGDFDILFKGGRGLAVGLQRAVHHDAGKAQLDGALAGLVAVAVIQVHGDRNLGIEFVGGQDQVIEVVVLREGAGAAAGLDDDRRLGFLRGLHDGLNLFHVVDVERADAVTAFGGLVEKLPSGD